MLYVFGLQNTLTSNFKSFMLIHSLVCGRFELFSKRKLIHVSGNECKCDADAVYMCLSFYNIPTPSHSPFSCLKIKIYMYRQLDR